MAAVPFVFGGSYDAVAGQKNFYDSQNFRAGQEDAARRQAAVDRGQQFQWAAQQADSAQQQAENERAQADYQAQLIQRQRDQELAQGRYEFGVNLAERKQEEKDKMDFSNRELQWKQNEFDARNKLVNQDSDYAEAVKVINSGQIDDPTKIAALFPNLSPIQMTKANEYWKTINDAKIQDYKQLYNAANSATAFVKAAKTIPAKPAGWLSKGVPASTPMITEDDAVNVLSKNKTYAKLAPQIEWNETDQRFEPIYKAPKGWVDPSSKAAIPATVPVTAGPAGARPTVTAPQTPPANPTPGPVIPSPVVAGGASVPPPPAPAPAGAPWDFRRLGTAMLTSGTSEIPYLNRMPGLAGINNPAINRIARGAIDAAGENLTPIAAAAAAASRGMNPQFAQPTPGTAANPMPNATPIPNRRRMFDPFMRLTNQNSPTIATPKNVEDYNALPVGAVYIDPVDGSTNVKR